MKKQNEVSRSHLKRDRNDKSLCHEKPTVAEKTGKCPVCNMHVDNTAYSVAHNRETFYFCSEGCLQKFQTEPWNYFGDHQYDLMFIGGGPAGLTAAVYASVSGINPDCSTSTEGIFACGDVTIAYGKRINIALGEGAKAVLRVTQFLKETKKKDQLKNYIS